jgi:Raf kinase inhibitor-like YbhB/YbcL family protein
MTIRLLSNAFTEGGMVPKRNACEGENLSPALSWSGAPGHSQSFALIVDDPDAPSGTFTHWVLFNIPAGASALPEGVAKNHSVSGIGQQGINDFHKTGYDGPRPPAGKAHRYYFKLYSLDTILTLPSGSTAAQLFRVMQGHILATGQLLGLYRVW